MSILVTQSVAELLVVADGHIRTTQSVSEVLAIDNASLLATQVIAEVLAIDSANLKVTQVIAEAVGSTQTFIPPPTPPPIIQVYPLFHCPLLPQLTNVQLVNKGVQSYADNLIGYDFIVYRGQESLNDVSGFSSLTNTNTWTPALSSYFTYAVRQDNTQDIKWPTLNVFNSKLGIAWLETHKTGVLHLNYAEAQATKSPVPANIPGNGQVYIYPYIPTTVTGTITENIPWDAVKVVDFAGNIFPINTYNATYGLGYNAETPDPVQAVRFLQIFRQSAVLYIKLTTAPTMTQTLGLIAPQPLPFYPITVYQGTSNFVFTKLKTALDGTVSVALPKGIYSFEIQTLNDSVLWQQTLL